MELFSSYGIIIACSVIIILSYIFNIISKRTSIPSVLLLISTGILINLVFKALDIQDFNFMPILELLGIVGLIMIVLEASLDLRLSGEKQGLIWRSFLIALLSLIFTASFIALILSVYLKTGLFEALIYAIPLSIISSAIVIPSTSGLDEEKKEFMIYESTFSDILGIMVFYFLLESASAESVGEISLHLFVNVFGTVAVSFMVSYILILIFQNIRTQVKLFLLIAVLVLLYSLAKLMHLSSLMIVLVFGLVLQNRHIFFAGKLKSLLREDSLKEISNNFRIITLESAFIVRTFFFVIFGITITLSSLYSWKVILVSIIILLVIYGLRYLIFRILSVKNYFPEIFLAPRGLITILLFYAIPGEIANDRFDPGVLLFIIIASSMAMTFSLVKARKRQNMETPFPGVNDTARTDQV
ncbi:MAG TPA: cation:proton antiporter [Bacteroidales bacterium]|nr:cation:proton antiporter [Bacteroidales bacterium]